MKIKVRLNKDITEEEFLIATFDDAEFNLGAYDIEGMKTTTLNGAIEEGDMEVEVFRKGKSTVVFVYSNSVMSIWENVED